MSKSCTMYTVDTIPFNNIIENERKWHQEKKAFKENYLKCLCKEDHFLLSLMQQRKDDEKRCEKMRKDIVQTKAEMKTVSTSIATLVKENQHLKAQVKNVDTVIQNKMIDEDVNPKYKNITRRTRGLDKTCDNYDAIKNTHKTILLKLHLYKEFLGCNIKFEEPNIYVFTFQQNRSHKEGCIKFQLDSEWTVLEYKPDNLLTVEDLEEFHERQDTQKLIGSLMIR